MYASPPPHSEVSGAMFQNQASDATFQNLPPDTIFCDHASDVYHEWYSVKDRCFQIVVWVIRPRVQSYATFLNYADRLGSWDPVLTFLPVEN